MDAKTWNALDEHEQETELHEAYAVAAKCAKDDERTTEGDPATLVHALAVLYLENERVTELESGDSEPRRRDM